jgi:hypothetical protein
MVRRFAFVAIACTASCTNDFDALFEGIEGDASVADTFVAVDTALPDTRDASQPDTAMAMDSGDTAADTSEVDAGCGETTYREMILCDKPLVYLRLADPTGTTAKDEMGAHNGTYFGTIMLGATGIVGDKGVHLGDGDTVNVAGSSAFEFLGNASFTVEAWVRLDPIPDAGTGDNFHYIADKHDTTNGGWGLRYAASTGALSMTRFYGGTTTDAAYRGMFILSDKFHHLVGVSDGAASRARLYLDGALLHEEPISKPLPSSGKPLLLGGLGTGSNLRGVLDEVAIYDRALSSARIVEHYNKGK